MIMAPLSVWVFLTSLPGLVSAQCDNGRADERRSHEPMGYVRFAEHDASEIPPFPGAPTNLCGKWYNFPKGNPNLTVEHDPSAPMSPPFVLSTRYPKGWLAGRGPVNWGGWDTLEWEKGGLKSEIYLSMWIKVVGSDFENNKGGTKAGFIGVGNRGGGHAELFFWLDNGSARQRTQSEFKLLFKQQAIPQPNGHVVRNLVQNVNRAALVKVGAWQHWEAVLKLNKLGVPNGTFQMWVDGQLTHDYRDVTYIAPSAPIGFNGFKWNPTWGGQGGSKSRSDFILIDHVYLSGRP